MVSVALHVQLLYLHPTLYSISSGKALFLENLSVKALWRAKQKMHGHTNCKLNFITKLKVYQTLFYMMQSTG